ncbi:MAG: hypothetical protein ABI432_06460 [Flavobacteriales bacterium]
MAQQDSAVAQRYDFWLGTWAAAWTNTDGTAGHATNTVTRIMDGKVIHEHFVDIASKFEGMSMSVFDPRDSLWHQAWADNNGSYFDFTGGSVDGAPSFITAPRIKADKVIIERMLFKDITHASFVWDWERSTDNGRTWTLAWRINYTRLGDP